MSKTSRADTNFASKNEFRARVSEFKKAKDKRAYRVYGQLEPTVINEELLTFACFAQGPTGEAGRLAEVEGIAFDSVKNLSLSYQNILKIDGLSQFTSLTELRLDNNIIEKIEGLDTLVNLVRLDLSFNHIRKIENLDNLVNLEDLSLFHNGIEKIENLDMNKKLRYLALGNNGVNVLTNILYLRRFKNLECLSLENNPVATNASYGPYIFAFLPTLKYLDYKNVLPEWKAEAYEKYQIAVDQLVEQQVEEEAREAEAAAQSALLTECRAAFIDRVHGDALFTAIFSKDPDGSQLCQVPTIKELVEHIPSFDVQCSESSEQLIRPAPPSRLNSCWFSLTHASRPGTYKEKVVDACRQLFESGQEEHRKRQLEEEALRECIGGAKSEAKARSLATIRAYEERKFEIIAKLDEAQQDSFQTLTESLLSELRQNIHDLWNDLMTTETTLVDQIEDVVNEFGRNLEERVSAFGEMVQVCFSKIRESAITFNERLAELTLTYTERIAKTDGPQDESYAIYADRDFVINALNNSKDNHVTVIDLTEEAIIKSIKAWFNDLMQDIRVKEEDQRHSNRVIEINLYIDEQRVDLESMELTQI